MQSCGLKGALRRRRKAASSAGVVDGGNLFPMDVVVDEGRSSVRIWSLGSLPLAKQDGKIIPSGFRVEKYWKGLWWEGETRVVDGCAEYRFSFKTQVGEWCQTPTQAYKQIAKLVLPAAQTSGKNWGGTNGRTLIGVTYPNPQKLIAAYFHDQASSVVETPARKKKKTSAHSREGGVAEKRTLRKRHVKVNYSEEEQEEEEQVELRRKRVKLSPKEDFGDETLPETKESAEENSSFLSDLEFIARTMTPWEQDACAEQLLDSFDPESCIV